MVTFVCEYCDVTLKKKQVQGHIRGRCSPGAMICIDCNNTFYGNDHKGHISCISQQQKHWGQFAKVKKTKQIAKDPKQENKSHQQTVHHGKQKNGQTQQKHQMVETRQAHRKKSEKMEEEAPVRKQSIKKQNKQQEDNQNLWKGWKNEIKELIRSNDNHIQKQDLQKKLRKVYKTKNQQKLTNEQFAALFEDKIQNIKKIKHSIFYSLQE